MEAASRFGGDGFPPSVRILSADEVTALMDAADVSRAEFDRVVRRHLGFSAELLFKMQPSDESAFHQFYYLIGHNTEDLIVAQVNWSSIDRGLIYMTDYHTDNFNDNAPVIPWTMGGIHCKAEGAKNTIYYNWSCFEESVDNGDASLSALVGALLGKERMAEAVSHFKKGTDLAMVALAQANDAYAATMDEFVDFNRSMVGLIVGRVADPRFHGLEYRSAGVYTNATKLREAAHSASAWVDALATVTELDRVAAYSAVRVPAAAIPAIPVTTAPPQKSGMTRATSAPLMSELVDLIEPLQRNVDAMSDKVRKSQILHVLEVLRRYAKGMPDMGPATSGGSLAPATPAAAVPTVDAPAVTEPVVAVAAATEAARAKETEASVVAVDVPAMDRGSASDSVDIHRQLKLAIDGINAVAVALSKRL
jgi:hypothetical protein